MLRRSLFLSTLFAFLLFPLAVFAQASPPALPSPDDLGAFASAIFGAVAGKQWGYLVALAVIGLVFAIRKFAGKLPAPVGPALEAFFQSDPGGVILAFLVAFATALAAAGSLSGAVLLAALKTALVAMGGFSLINKLLLPLVQLVIAKLFPSGKEQAAQVVAQAAQNEQAANAKPAEPGSAASNLEQIK